jgi:HAD superfamily hydrolase (TIGR01509 family)
MLVIFDCDGVLVDTEPVANRCFAAALAQEGLSWTVEETMRRLMGRSVKTCVGICEQALGRALSSGFLERLQADTYQAFRDLPITAVPGVVNALDGLEARRLSYCVASSGDVDKMRLTLGLAGLWERFDGRVFSASMVPRGKPFPDLFLHAARQMRVAPERCVVVEDAVPGVQAGRAAGMRVLAYVGAPYADRAALAAAGGEVFDDMQRVPELAER